jgi:hypothetical protein
MHLLADQLPVSGQLRRRLREREHVLVDARAQMLERHSQRPQPEPLTWLLSSRFRTMESWQSRVDGQSSRAPSTPAARSTSPWASGRRSRVLDGMQAKSGLPKIMSTRVVEKGC